MSCVGELLALCVLRWRCMKYKIEVHSLGYEDACKIVEASTLAIAKAGFNIDLAIIEWCQLNDIDVDDNFRLPFTRVTKVS